MKTVLLKMRYQDVPKDYQGSVMLPVMDDSDKVPMGEVMADIKSKRNPGNHKRFFAFRNTTFLMQDVYDHEIKHNEEIWRKQLLLNAGHVDEIISPKSGKVGYVVKTINWDEMDEIEFKEIFSSVVNAFLKWYGHDLDEIQINSILEF